MKKYYTENEIAEALGGSVSVVRDRAKKEGWKYVCVIGATPIERKFAPQSSDRLLNDQQYRDELFAKGVEMLKSESIAKNRDNRRTLENQTSDRYVCNECLTPCIVTNYDAMEPTNCPYESHAESMGIKKNPVWKKEA